MACGFLKWCDGLLAAIVLYAARKKCVSGLIVVCYAGRFFFQKIKLSLSVLVDLCRVSGRKSGIAVNDYKSTGAKWKCQSDAEIRREHSAYRAARPATHSGGTR